MLTGVDSEVLRVLRLEAASWRAYQESMRRHGVPINPDHDCHCHEAKNQTPFNPREVIYVGLLL